MVLHTELRYDELRKTAQANVYVLCSLVIVDCELNRRMCFRFSPMRVFSNTNRFKCYYSNVCATQWKILFLYRVRAHEKTVATPYAVRLTCLYVQYTDDGVINKFANVISFCCSDSHAQAHIIHVHCSLFSLVRNLFTFWICDAYALRTNEQSLSHYTFPVFYVQH